MNTVMVDLLVCKESGESVKVVTTLFCQSLDDSAKSGTMHMVLCVPRVCAMPWVRGRLLLRITGAQVRCYALTIFPSPSSL